MVFRFCPAWELPDAKRTQFARFLDTQATAHPFQFLEWSPLGSALRTRSYCCWMEEGGNVRAFARANVIHPATRLLPSHRALILTRGPVCDNSGILARFLAQVVPAARALGFAYVDVSPECLATEYEEVQRWLAENHWLPQRNSRASLRLDLRPDPELLLSGFRKTTRHEIRCAERAAVCVEPASNSRDCETFSDLLEAMADEKHFAAESRADVRHVWHWIASEPARGVLLLARNAERVQGGVMIIRAARRAWYIWGATQKQRPYSVGHLLQWRAILWAKAAGCTEYDFGGYTPGATDGPACFKHGFCDHLVQFLPVHRYVLNDARYERCVSWMRWRHGDTVPEGLHVPMEGVR